MGRSVPGRDVPHEIKITFVCLKIWKVINVGQAESHTVFSSDILNLCITEFQALLTFPISNLGQAAVYLVVTSFNSGISSSFTVNLLR